MDQQMLILNDIMKAFNIKMDTLKKSDHQQKD